MNTCSVLGCDKKHVAGGLCRMHYTRNSRHGDPSKRSRIAPGEAFKFALDISKIRYHDACIYWPFSKNKQGQGQVSYKGKNSITTRVVCELAHGEPPTSSHHAAHSCGMGHICCINPKHLRWATPKENAQDKILHGTYSCGEKHHSSILKEDDVIFILKNEDNLSNIKLGKMFGISDAHVCGIRKRKFWKHITL